MNLVPVICPQCGERQNQMVGRAAPDGFMPDTVVCMACQYEFDDTEYQAGLELAKQEISQRLAERSGKIG